MDLILVILVTCRAIKVYIYDGPQFPIIHKKEEIKKRRTTRTRNQYICAKNSIIPPQPSLKSIKMPTCAPIFKIIYYINALLVDDENITI